MTATMTASELKAAIHDAIFGIHRKSSVNHILATVANAAMASELPYSCYHAACGVDFAIRTGRVSGQTTAKIEGMTRAKLVGLLARIAMETEAEGFVPAWLNENVA